MYIKKLSQQSAHHAAAVITMICMRQSCCACQQIVTAPPTDPNEAAKGLPANCLHFKKKVAFHIH